VLLAGAAWPDGGWIAHVFASVASVATYVAVLRALGLDPSDRELLRLGRKRG
jgi:hypothetical protein